VLKRFCCNSYQAEHFVVLVTGRLPAALYVESG
jgi:hypothetical protein